ncbi:MAG: DUF2617 family protein [Planctomycetota bacterium]
MTARPSADTLVWRLFDRALHPDLIDAVGTTHVDAAGGRLTLHVEPAGHMLVWRREDRMLFEVLSDATRTLPDRGLVRRGKLRGTRIDHHDKKAGIRYRASQQIEQVDEEVFAHLHEEMTADLTRATLAHRFGSKNRLAPQPLALLHVEPTADAVTVHGYHTYPQQLSIVRTQTLIEIS